VQIAEVMLVIFLNQLKINAVPTEKGVGFMVELRLVLDVEPSIR